uniref:Probable RNA-binding protein 18 n=1 Tax=Ailuropoda melanoleuca TaxID=9646 RepID=A0A7N5KLZ5_AILME
MEAETKTLPLENASILSEGSLQEGHRLWIGNLDPKITEYHLLKLLQKFGTVKQFDFLFHKSGALEGQPRGYCFVNFETKQAPGLRRLTYFSDQMLWGAHMKHTDILLPGLEAEQAIQCLNGKLALSKKLVVRWAHAQVKRYDHNKNDKILPISLEPSSSTEPTQSNLRIHALKKDWMDLPRSSQGAGPWSTKVRRTVLTLEKSIFMRPEVSLAFVIVHSFLPNCEFLYTEC